MPKSKRDVKISLTKTGRKGLQFKQQCVQDIRALIDQYERIFVFSVENTRNSKLKDLREQWKDSRFYFGKTRTIQLGLGKTKEEEPHPNLHKLSRKLAGGCGLLFTNRSKQEVVDFFESYREPEYARAGFVATEDVILPEGPLPGFSHAQEPFLRQLGMPTSLQRGVITLLSDYQVCKKGAALTVEQAHILKLLKTTIAEFYITIKCMWDKSTNKIKKFESSDVNGTDDNFSLRMEAD